MYQFSGNHPSSSKNILLLIKKNKSYVLNTLTTLPSLKHADVSNRRLKSLCFCSYKKNFPEVY